MTLQDWAAFAVAVAGIATTIWAGVKTLSDRKQGVRATELAERRDTVADRDALIDQVQEERDTAITRATTAEARAAAAETELAREREYTQVLRDHIYRRREPPPPPRT